MRLVFLIALLAGLVAGLPAMAQEKSPSGIVRYLGLAVPYPDTLLENPEVPAGGGVRFPETVRAWLTVDSSGTTRTVTCADDSAVYIDPVRAELEALHFSFTPGIDISPTLSIPVTINFSGRTTTGWNVKMLFPVSAEQATDSVLLKEFFAANGVEPPRITAMMPIKYGIAFDQEKLRYWTITAQVSLDAEGDLMDITYPIAGQDAMRHPVQMALIRAEYTPTRLKGKPLATDFLVTFRIFDNIKYPFSPLDLTDTADVPLAARYFMTYYYNENDISLYPIPRRPADQTLQSSQLGRLTGFAEVTVDIDTAGTVTGARVGRTVERTRHAAYKAARLLQWYPAIDVRSQPTDFTGEIRFDFVGSPKIVYIPEWIPR